jgi:quinolinate synthase
MAFPFERDIAQETCAKVMYAELKAKLADTVPDFELKMKAEAAACVNELKKSKNAIILGHNYMEPALFNSVPDFTGDSLELCRAAVETDADIIVFCGVRFMAETAKLLNPDKTVLLPSEKAGCSLAESITPEDVRSLKARFPGVPVVAYINTYADLKAEVDVCCTSSNAARVVEALGGDAVILIPDGFLTRNVAKETGRTVFFPKPGGNGGYWTAGDDFQLIGWEGRCEVHEKFQVHDIENVRVQFPDAKVLAHPECSPEVVEASDFSGSTSAMIRYVDESVASRYLLLTECAMGDNVAAANPGKEMLRVCSVRCPHMNQITVENTRAALMKNQFVIEIDEDIAHRARRAIDRMMAIQ